MGDKVDSITQKKRATEAKSRKNAKRVKTYHAVGWEDYNVNFAVPGTGGAQDVPQFLKQLDALSIFPTTRQDIIAQLTFNLKTLKSKNELLIAQQAKLEHLAYNPNFPEHDVITITDNQSLNQVISCPFRMPILHRATTEHPSLNPYPKFGIEDFLKHLAKDNEASLCVYDYSISQPSQRTRSTTVSELLECFQSEHNSRPLNFLDIENRTYHQFCPPPIIQHNIMTNLGTQIRDRGKTGSTWDPKPPKEFFLASSKNSVSTIHVDTGGQVTWILILEGIKIWYFPRYLTSQTVRWLELAGPEDPKYYEGGWIKVELRRGDLL